MVNAGLRSLAARGGRIGRRGEGAEGSDRASEGMASVLVSRMAAVQKFLSASKGTAASTHVSAGQCKIMCQKIRETTLDLDGAAQVAEAAALVEWADGDLERIMKELASKGASGETVADIDGVGASP